MNVSPLSFTQYHFLAHSHRQPPTYYSLSLTQILTTTKTKHNPFTLNLIMAGTRKSNTQILQELEELSDTMYKSHTSSTRRTASLVLPRTAVPPISSSAAAAADDDDDDEIAAAPHAPLAADTDLNLNPKPGRSIRRMSLSPFKSRPQKNNDKKEAKNVNSSTDQKSKWADESSGEKKGIWSWKPIRVLSRIGMQKLSCLFSVEVVTVQGLPASMNGLRLSVCVRKKENKDGAVQTMPSRVSQCAADFEETLFIRCHVYYSSNTPAAGTNTTGGTNMKFEPRPFLIYVVAVDAEELDFGKNSVDLSGLIQESIEKSFEGTRIRQWDTSFSLSGKAKGGEVVLKLGFQIMEKDGGIGIYSQAEGLKSGKSKTFSPSIARKQSKSSFSVASPRMTSIRAEGRQSDDHHHLQGIDDLNLDDEPAVELETKMDDNDFPEFDVVDKGVEKIQDSKEDQNSDKISVSSFEVVKEVVQDQSHVRRLTELDSIAQQIKALESMMMVEDKTLVKDVDDEEEEEEETGLDAEEDKVTREFLQMLEHDKAKDQITPLKLENYEEGGESDQVYLPDLGKGLGCVVQMRNGGYLAAMNPLDTYVARKDKPKLAMQISKPCVIQTNITGFEVFQKMAAIGGVEQFTSEMLALMPMDELIGKTAEQIAFEGIASAIIQGRNKEGATSSAARTIAAVKSLVNAMNNGRKERVSTGIWNVSEEPVTVDEILAFSMQKIENMTLDSLKIQADISEEEAPFDVSPLDAKTTAANGNVYDHILSSAVPIDDWIKESESITISVVVQLRDPIRQYEAVGGPMIALIHAAVDKSDIYNSEEKRYKVASLQIGGVKVRSAGTKNVWDNEKQKLTALQWLVAYGMGKAGKKGKHLASKGPDLLWSISSRVMADMWLKPIRNPDVKFTNKEK